MNGMVLDDIDRKHALAELETCRDEMLEKLYQMKELIQNICGDNRLIWTRADMYWWTAINNNLAEPAGSFAGSMCNLNDTLKELKQHSEDMEEGGCNPKP